MKFPQGLFVYFARFENVNINNLNDNINKIKSNIDSNNMNMEIILIEIGKLTNDKNDVEMRDKLLNELKLISSNIVNEELKINVNTNKINNYENCLKQITENKSIELGINAAKNKINSLEDSVNSEKENIFIKKSLIAENQNKIISNEQLIENYKLQE